MAACIVCGQPGLYYDFHLHGMACAKHAGADVQVAALRNLTSTLVKALSGAQLVDEQSEIAQIIRQLRPLLKD